MAAEVVSESALKAFIGTVLRRVGMDDDNSWRATEVLVEADLRGIDSHGVASLPGRASALRSGALAAKAKPTMVRRFGSTALLEGHQGFGPALCSHAIETAVALARDGGIGLVALRNSSHWACPAYYSRWMAQQGYFGISMTNSNPAMPLHGSAVKSVSSAPLAIAAPHRGHEPIVLDMSFQQLSWGGMRIAADEGQSLPGPWGYDQEGRQTNDPAAIIASGRVRPIGDHKGSGFAFMQEILTGVLGAGMISRQIAVMAQRGEPAHYSQTFIAIRPDLFADQSVYDAQIEALYASAKAAPLAEGFSEINLPGDRSNATLVARRRDGIPLKRIRKALAELSQTFEIPAPGNDAISSPLLWESLMTNAPAVP